MQEGVLFDGAAAAVALLLAILRLRRTILAVVRGRRDVRNLLGDGVLAADGRDANI